MKLLASVILLVSATAGHAVAIYTGLYDVQRAAGWVWFDNVLHFAVGVGFGLMALWFFSRLLPQTSFRVKAAGVAGFVLGMALCWELFEVALYVLFEPRLFGLTLYAPSPAEGVWDSLSNMAGAATLLLCVYVCRLLPRDN